MTGTTRVRPVAARWRLRAPSGRVLDIVVLIGLLALAAALRLPDLATRGPWDADQGEQMLAIRAILGGRLELLGPPTSTGGFHHGPVFYYLAALFALPSGGNDPAAVTLGVALGGIATVACVWWMGHAAGGRVAALVAGVLAAVSAQMIDASVRLWNPAVVAPAAALALAAVLEARRQRDPRWWVAVAVGIALAGQSHVLAWVLAAPIGLFVLDELRRSGRRAVPWLAAAAGIVVVSFIPLVVSELATGFSELQALMGAEPGVENGPGILLRAIFVPFRVAAVPLVGDVVAAVAATTTAAALVVGASVLAAHPATPFASVARLLAIGLAVGMAGLVVGAPWLSTVTPLFVDHYHLALDPIVFALLGLAAAVLWRRRPGRWLVGGIVGAIAAWNLVAVPLPTVNPDGGWPAGLVAGKRVVEQLDGARAVVVGVPSFKKTTAVDYPMTVLGNPPAPQGTGATRVVVLCDRLFEEVLGSACRGPAEAQRLAEVGIAPGPLLDRFEAAPGRWISVYEVAGR